MSKDQPRSCTNDLSKAELAHHAFLCQGIFERRKTQYVFFLFFLGVAGLCSNAVLAAKHPHERLLILMVPILLQIPVYITWWYQRNQISMLDRARKQIVDPTVHEEPSVSWHDKSARYAVDIVLLGIPLVLVLVGWWLFHRELSKCVGNEPFTLLFVSAISAVVASVIIGWVNHVRDKSDRGKKSQTNDESADSQVDSETTSSTTGESET